MKKRNKKTGQFIKTPQGKKTKRMLEVEKKLLNLNGKATTLEEDYQKYYVELDWGQKRLSNRWGVEKNRIFRNKEDRKGRGRSWVKMLDLKVKDENAVEYYQKPKPRICSICEDESPLERAHWVPNANGGSNEAWNLIKLCGSCHDKFDKLEDKEITEKILKYILRRECFKIFDTKHDLKTQNDEIYLIIKKILNGCKYRNINF